MEIGGAEAAGSSLLLIKAGDRSEEESEEGEGGRSVKEVSSSASLPLALCSHSVAATLRQCRVAPLACSAEGESGSVVAELQPIVLPLRVVAVSICSPRLSQPCMGRRHLAVKKIPELRLAPVRLLL